MFDIFQYIGTLDVPRPSSRVEIVAAMRRIRVSKLNMEIIKMKKYPNTQWCHSCQKHRPCMIFLLFGSHEGRNGAHIQSLKRKWPLKWTTILPSHSPFSVNLPLFGRMLGPFTTFHWSVRSTYYLILMLGCDNNCYMSIL